MSGDDDLDRGAPGEALPAGRFTVWLGEITRAIRGEGTSDVPCGSCTACCEASQFVHVGPDEADALAHIPAALLFPAPGLPKGHRLMGYDEQGRCPMLVEGRCSIYEHRPRTCRTYDCRIFAAADVLDDDPTKARVAERARRWVFDEPLADDVARHGAVRAAATFLAEHADRLPADLAPVTATQRAVLAVEVHGVFLDEDGRLLEGAEPADVLDRIRREVPERSTSRR
jgi:hypothetical protein